MPASQRPSPRLCLRTPERVSTPTRGTPVPRRLLPQQARSPQALMGQPVHLRKNPLSRKFQRRPMPGLASLRRTSPTTNSSRACSILSRGPNLKTCFPNPHKPTRELKIRWITTWACRRRVLSAQRDVADETGIGGYPASPAFAGWRAISFEMSVLSQEFESHHGVWTVDVENNSIMAGTMPSRSLLTALDLLNQDRPTNSSISPSSARSSSPRHWLWLPPCGRRLTALRSLPGAGNQSDDRPDRLRETVNPVSPWTVYVMGLDQAFDRSCRDICQGLFTEAGPTASSESGGRPSAVGPEWRMSVVPMAESDRLDAGRGAMRQGAFPRSDTFMVTADPDFVSNAASATEPELPSGSDRHAQSESNLEHAVPPSFSIVTVIAGSILIAGWCWTRRASSPRLPGARVEFQPGMTRLARSPLWPQPWRIGLVRASTSPPWSQAHSPCACSSFTSSSLRIF